MGIDLAFEHLLNASFVKLAQKGEIKEQEPYTTRSISDQSGYR